MVIAATVEAEVEKVVVTDCPKPALPLDEEGADNPFARREGCCRASRASSTPARDIIALSAASAAVKEGTRFVDCASSVVRMRCDRRGPFAATEAERQAWPVPQQPRYAGLSLVLGT